TATTIFAGRSRVIIDMNHRRKSPRFRKKPAPNILALQCDRRFAGRANYHAQLFPTLSQIVPASKTKAVMVGDRVHVTYKQRKRWIGITIDLKTRIIAERRLPSAAEA